MDITFCLSEQENYRYDYDLVNQAFAANDKVWSSTATSSNVRKDGIPNMKALLAACLQNGCHIAVDSDAHSTWQLRHGLTALYGMLEECNFPEELIINATTANLTAELKLHGKACAGRSRRNTSMSKYTIGIDLGAAPP